MYSKSCARKRAKVTCNLVRWVLIKHFGTKSTYKRTDQMLVAPILSGSKQTQTLGLFWNVGFFFPVSHVFSEKIN